MELAGGGKYPTGSVLVMFAVPDEARPLLRMLRQRNERPQRLNQREPTRGVRAWSFSGGQIWVSGMGRRNASRALEQALQAAPTSVLTCGFAGGLNPSLPTGTVLLEADRDFPGETRLVQAGATRGSFCCVERVAVTVEAKTRLRHQTGADAVEMESGVIRELCRARGIPAATLRVISDAAHEPLPLDFGALMTPDERIDFLKLAFTVACSPSKIPALTRFQRQVSSAANALTRVLVSVLSRD